MALARRNVDRLNLAGRVRVCRGDMFAGLQGMGLEGTLDVVVCNPPSISSSRLERDLAHLLEHEPREAVEFGAGQERQVELLVQRSKAYGEVKWATGAQGVPRVARIRRRGVGAR